MTDVIEKDSNMEEQASEEADSNANLDTSALTTEQFLALVGSRVRKSRMAINMSRKLLAKRSGVSERYLAQLESGQGNISIKLLRKVALAIGVRLDTLMSEQDIDPSKSASRPEFMG